MKIYRLNAQITGTSRSITLDEDETFRTIIPTWIPNADQDLYSVNDYIGNMIESAPIRSGDWIQELKLESTEVADSIDLTSHENILIYGADDGKGVNWIPEVNLVHYIINQIIIDDGLFQSDLFELAAQITNGKSLFGWCNVDPGDLIPEIASELSIMGIGSDVDSYDEIDKDDD